MPEKTDAQPSKAEILNIRNYVFYLSAPLLCVYDILIILIQWIAESLSTNYDYQLSTDHNIAIFSDS